MASSDRIRWSEQDLDELAQTYWSEIAPAMRRDGLDPGEEKPSYQWLVDHGFRGLEYALRTHHDHTLSEFFEDVVGVGVDKSPTEGYDWGLSDEDVTDALEEHIRSLRRRREDISEQTAEAKRSRIAKYARTFDDLHEAGQLIEIATEPSQKAEVRQKVLAVFDILNDELATAEVKIRYHGDVKEFYDRLESWGRVAFNPVAEIRNEYGWSREKPDNPALSTSDVQALYHKAETVEERLLVVGLSGWGLRTSELASLHQRQINLVTDDPHIEFEERKNGPGTVSIIYGLDELADQIADLSDEETWNGYVFPSERAASGHRSADTIRDRFKRLADRAGVRIRGETPQPKMGRRFWYDTYLEAMGTLQEQLDEIAGDQGSASSDVVERNYISEERRRAFRRKHMREKLEQAFVSNNN
jgi:integrase